MWKRKEWQKMHKQWGKGGWTSTWSKLLMFGRVFSLFPFLSSRFGNDKQTSIGSSRVHAPVTSCAQISINIPNSARVRKPMDFLTPPILTRIYVHTRQGSFVLLHTPFFIVAASESIRHCVHIRDHYCWFWLMFFLNRQEKNRVSHETVGKAFDNDSANASL